MMTMVLLILPTVFLASNAIQQLGCFPHYTVQYWTVAEDSSKEDGFRIAAGRVLI